MKLVKKSAVLKAVIFGLMALPQLGFAGRFGMTGKGYQEEIRYDVLCKGKNSDTGISYKFYINTKKGEAYWEQNWSGRGGVMILGKYHDVTCDRNVCTGINFNKNEDDLIVDIRDCEKTAEKSAIVNF